MTPFPSILAALVLLATLAPSSTHAQSMPAVVEAAAFTKAGRKFYVAGGEIKTVKTNQFFSLDLTKPWPASQPNWSQLAPGPMASFFPIAFSKDETKMIAFKTDGASFANIYDVPSNTWAPSTLTGNFALWPALPALTDPESGIVYIPSGYSRQDRSAMDMYSFTSDSITTAGIPPNLFPSRAYFSGAWSRKRASAIYFGGYNGSFVSVPTDNVLTEFVPASQTWTTLSTSGNPPAMRADHCMTSNDDGSIIVVYGGRLGPGTLTGEVHLFDTMTNTWRQGTPGPPRLYATCTVAGDQLLIWGGVSGPSILAPAAILIYNIASNSWVQQYTPPASYLLPSTTAGALPTPSGGGSGNGSGNGSGGQSGSKGDGSTGGGSNVGAIAGGVVGGLAVVCGIILFVIFRRRRQQQQDPAALVAKMNADNEEKDRRQPHAPLPASAEERQLQEMRQQLQNQQEQLELQGRLLEIQQQKNASPMFATHQPLQYQDPNVSFGYQPPVYYASPPQPMAHSLALSDATYPPVSTQVFSPVTSAAGESPLNSHSGYVSGNGYYADQTPLHVNPVIYTPPPMQPQDLKKPDSKASGSSSEDKVPQNPHAIVD